MCSDNISLLKDIIIPVATQFLGFVLAGLSAFLVARWQIEKQNQSQKERDAKYLDELFEQVRLELRDNKNLVGNRMKEVANLGGMSYDEHWTYLATMANAIKFTGYETLLRSGLAKNLPKKTLAAINASYSHLDSLKNLILMGQSGQAYYKLVGKDDLAKTMLQNVRTYIGTAISGLEYGFEIVAGTSAKGDK